MILFNFFQFYYLTHDMSTVFVYSQTDISTAAKSEVTNFYALEKKKPTKVATAFFVSA